MNRSHRPLPFLLLAASVLAAGCAPSPPPPRQPEGTIINLEEGPQAHDQPVTEAPAVAPPTADQSLYLVHVRNAAGQVIEGCRVMLLSQKPEPLYLREPRKKTRILYLYTPNYGRVEFMVQADGKPKYLLVGGDGFKPSVRELKPAIGGQTQEIEVVTEILPIAHLIIEDHLGNRVDRPMVTMRPPADAPNPYHIEGLAPNEGMTEIGDDLGEVKLTRPVGRYLILASKGTAQKGACRHYEILDWDGRPDPIVIRLPEKSEPKPDWFD